MWSIKPKLVFCGPVIFSLLISSCQVKRGGQTFGFGQKVSTPIFIELPQSNNVFENISGLIYESLVDHFRRVGYKVMDNQRSAYSLQITIKSLEPIQKYVSPDILLFHSTLKLELLCQLLNFNKEAVASKSFYFSQLVSKPNNPSLNSDFLNYEYKKLMWRAAPKIEQYFRKFLLKID
jgi:hypothetical protein